MVRAQDRRMWGDCYGNFTPVAEVARIHQRALENRRSFQKFPRRKGPVTADFSGIFLWKTLISATLVRVKIASPPPILYSEERILTTDLPVDVANRS